MAGALLELAGDPEVSDVSSGMPASKEISEKREIVERFGIGNHNVHV